MQLNLPILDQLKDTQHILILGMGGGHDILGGLPIYFTLRDLGLDVHLANYSFSDFDIVRFASNPINELQGLVLASRGDVRRKIPYYPEGYLTEWFLHTQGEHVPVWMINKMGVQPVRVALEHIVDKLDIDAIILVDGGVDSIMHGDESAPGTITEDSITLGAVRTLSLPVMIQACIGFGTEVEEGLNHYLALQNMATLIKAGAFYGSCSLTPQMIVYQQYEAACRYIFEQPRSSKSHIHVRIVPAVLGEFGYTQMYDDGIHPSRAFISPLMSIYWFFDAREVIARNQLLDLLEDTHLAQEAMQIVMKSMMQRKDLRSRGEIPY